MATAIRVSRRNDDLELLRRRRLQFFYALCLFRGRCCHFSFAKIGVWSKGTLRIDENDDRGRVLRPPRDERELHIANTRREPRRGDAGEWSPIHRLGEGVRFLAHSLPMPAMLYEELFPSDADNEWLVRNASAENGITSMCNRASAMCNSARAGAGAATGRDCAVQHAEGKGSGSDGVHKSVACNNPRLFRLQNDLRLRLTWRMLAVVENWYEMARIKTHGSTYDSLDDNNEQAKDERKGRKEDVEENKPSLDEDNDLSVPEYLQQLCTCFAQICGKETNWEKSQCFCASGIARKALWVWFLESSDTTSR